MTQPFLFISVGNLLFLLVAIVACIALYWAAKRTRYMFLEELMEFVHGLPTKKRDRSAPVVGRIPHARECYVYKPGGRCTLLFGDDPTPYNNMWADEITVDGNFAVLWTLVPDASKRIHGVVNLENKKYYDVPFTGVWTGFRQVSGEMFQLTSTETGNSLIQGLWLGHDVKAPFYENTYPFYRKEKGSLLCCPATGQMFGLNLDQSGKLVGDVHTKILPETVQGVFNAKLLNPNCLLTLVQDPEQKDKYWFRVSDPAGSLESSFLYFSGLTNLKRFNLLQIGNKWVVSLFSRSERLSDDLPYFLASPCVVIDEVGKYTYYQYSPAYFKGVGEDQGIYKIPTDTLLSNWIEIV